MEDAHLIHIRDNWAFFGVFDGHGGQACSEFVAPRIGKELEAKGCPKDRGLPLLYDSPISTPLTPSIPHLRRVTLCAQVLLIPFFFVQRICKPFSLWLSFRSCFQGTLFIFDRMLGDCHGL